MHTHRNVPKSSSGASNIEVKPHSYFLLFSPIGILLQCDALLSRDWKSSTNSPDDIINDKSGFFSTSAVLNASFYNVYYQWFGPGVGLHLGMARNHFLELSIKDLHVKDRPKSDRYK